MDGLQQQIADLLPQRYARAAKRAAALAKELADRVGVEVDAEILYLATASEEDIAAKRAQDPYEWGIEIRESDGSLVVAMEGGNVPLTEEAARWEFRRWPGYGYDCQRIVRRVPAGPWETVDA